MNFSDQARLKESAIASGTTLPAPNRGDRICEACEPRVALVLDMSRPGYEYRCPKCGSFEEWFGLRFLPKPGSETAGPESTADGRG